MKVPTQIIAYRVKTLPDGRATLKGDATIVLEINDSRHTCEIEMIRDFGTDTNFNDERFEEWTRLTSEHAVALRTVTLIAIPSTDVIGSSHFAITTIDLQLGDGEDRFYTQVIS